jgi:hypothetical protein
LLLCRRQKLSESSRFTAAITDNCAMCNGSDDLNVWSADQINSGRPPVVAKTVDLVKLGNSAGAGIDANAQTREHDEDGR